MIERLSEHGQATASADQVTGGHRLGNATDFGAPAVVTGLIDHSTQWQRENLQGLPCLRVLMSK